MERARLDLSTTFADEADDPVAQLGSGLVRERYRQDPPRRHVLDTHEIGDPVSEDAGLAGASPGEDEERALRGRHGAGLLGVERLDDLLRAFGAAALDDRGVGRRCGRSGRILTRERGVAQPIGLGRAGRRVGFRGVGEAGAGDGRGLVERGLAAALPGGGTHLRILGGGGHRSLCSGRQFPGAT